MNMQPVSSSTIKVNLPSGILTNAQSEAKRIGISLQDFIRLLMATYFAQAQSIQAVSRVSYGSQAWWREGEALVDRELLEKKFKAFSSMKDAIDYLSALP